MIGLDHAHEIKASIEHYLGKQGRDPDLSFFFRDASDAFVARDQFGRLTHPILIFPRMTWGGVQESAVITFADRHDAAIFRMFYETFGGEE
jgi:hypothetical protein